MGKRFNPEIHHRRSIRLKDYDYTQSGAYFVTIVIRERMCLFGGVDDSDMCLNEAGNMVSTVWNSLAKRFADIDLDTFIVMPNHIHGIIVLSNSATQNVGAPLVGARSNAIPSGERATTRVAPTASLDVVVGAYKSLTTVHYTHGVKMLRWPPFPRKLWQRNYYEHIIRDDKALNKIRQYIMENPERWPEDPENPFRQPAKSPVGAPLVGARFDSVSSGKRANTRVAPTKRDTDGDTS